MSLHPDKNSKGIGRKSGILGSIRNKFGRSKSTSSNNASSSPASRGIAVDQSAPPPAYTPTSPTDPSHNSAPISNNNPPTSQSDYPAPWTTPSTSAAPTPAERAPPHDLDGSPYAFLSTFDTVLLIDDSGSMSYGAVPTPWEQVRTALQTLAPVITAYDSDGIDIYFMNYKTNHRGEEEKGVAGTGFYNILNAHSVEEVWTTVSRPQGLTPTGRRIRDILSPYMEHLRNETKYKREVKPLNLIVITDGVATDDPESEIVRVAKELNRLDAPLSQVGIQFFQVGEDKKATRALQQLDDALEEAYHIRDMVDTITWDGRNVNAGLSADSIVKAVQGSVNKRLDRQPASGEHSRPWPQ